MKLLSFLLFSALAFAQVPTPESVLGHKPGDDYFLASYDESLGYFRKLAAAAPDRVRLEQVGKTTQGRDWYIALISSPSNLRDLAKYKSIAQKLALVRGLDDASAHALAREGKAIVHIDGGLHATEVAHAQHTIQLAYDLVTDPAYSKILDDVILVLWFSINPDGQNMVVDWYRSNLGTSYEVSPLPWLWQEYIGHDNNRDGYMNNMIESRVITKAMLDYYPQVMYNHHQTAPFPARIWIPPFAEPVSSNVHPLMWRWTNFFGTSMATYLDEHAMPGAMHRGRFDDWYPGFVDHVNSFRNTVSFLTETALYRYATPKFYTIDEFPKDKQDLRTEVMYASPWRGGWWRLNDAVRYMLGASMAVLQTSAKYKEDLLYNRYQAGRDIVARYKKEPPFAYVIPRDTQADAPVAGILIEKLMLNGIEVHEASRAVKVNGIEYPAGTWVILMDQPFAALVKDLFEIQKYPELPDAPYDVTGWTLPLQMGVETAAVLEPVSADLRAGLKRIAAAPRVNVPPARTQNASFRVINESLAAGKPVTKLDPIPAKAPRIGVFRPWQSSMDEGWTRWILEDYKFPFVSLYNADIQAGHLKERFDVILFADMPARSITDGYQVGSIPGQYAGGIGAAGIDAIRDFVNSGGTLVALNASTAFAIKELNLPVTNVLADLKPAEFNCPGALLRLESQELKHPLLTGLPKQPIVMFERGPAFETKPGFKGKVLASYAKEGSPLVSGYLLHPEKLQGKAAALDVAYGSGHVVLLGFRPQWRGQSHGTYKFLFNALYYFGNVVPAPETPPATNPQADQWKTLSAGVKADAEKLVTQNKAFHAARGVKALEESKKLDTMADAFAKDRGTAIDNFKDQTDDRALARKVADYAVQIRKLAGDAKTKELADLEAYKLDANALAIANGLVKK